MLTTEMLKSLHKVIGKELRNILQDIKWRNISER